MSYQDDESACREAAAHRIRDDDAARVSATCRARPGDVGGVDVRGHVAEFRAAAWRDLPDSPGSLLDKGWVSRGELLDMGEQVRAEKLSPVALFAASFAWGTGMTGYGPRRYREIIDAAGTRLEPSLRQALDAAYQNRDSPDPVAAYAQLYGGYDHDRRTKAGQDPWCRLHKLGPAFFTKYLYFAVPGSLILDNRVANAVHRLSGLPHLVTADRKSIAWTPYRYAVYLHWMQQTAKIVGASPEMLELTLFQLLIDPLDEQDADGCRRYRTCRQPSPAGHIPALRMTSIAIDGNTL